MALAPDAVTAGRGWNRTAVGGRGAVHDLARRRVDAVLRWRAAGNEDDIKGYSILLRPDPRRHLGAGSLRRQVNTYTMKDVSIDDLKFRVKAIGGQRRPESLVTAYVYPPRQKVEIETVQ